MLELLFKRRSTRKYGNLEIEKEKIDAIINAALLSPSSRNLKPLDFIFVQDKSLLNELSKTKKHGSEFIKNASLGIIIAADPEKSDVWVEDASIASIIIQLTAESLGLSSCWIQVRKRFHNELIKAEDYIKDLLKIPEKYKILSMISIGYKNENLRPHSEEELKFDKIHINKFNNRIKK